MMHIFLNVCIHDNLKITLVGYFLVYTAASRKRINNSPLDYGPKNLLSAWQYCFEFYYNISFEFCICRCTVNIEQTTWWLPSLGRQCLKVTAKEVIINDTTNNVSIFFYHIDFIFVLNFEIIIINGTSNYKVINLKQNMEKQLHF